MKNLNREAIETQLPDSSYLSLAVSSLSGEVSYFTDETWALAFKQPSSN
jgi:hypothetical protein